MGRARMSAPLKKRMGRMAARDADESFSQLSAQSPHDSESRTGRKGSVRKGVKYVEKRRSTPESRGKNGVKHEKGRGF